MSKLFSAPFKALCLSLILLAGCDNGGNEDQGDARIGARDVITRADTSVDEVASAEPGTERHQWVAADGNTRALLGNMTASVEGRGGPLMLAFATGVTVQGERDVRMSASDQIGVSPTTFSSVLNADPEAAVFLYRVVDQVLAPVARQGICDQDKPTFLGVSEYVGSDGKWVFKIAAFKGEVVPGPGAQGDPDLCGVFLYAMP
jgi:hypothetical protein